MHFLFLDNCRSVNCMKYVYHQETNTQAINEYLFLVIFTFTKVVKMYLWEKADHFVISY